MHYKYRPIITQGSNGTTIRHTSTEDNPILDLGEIDGYKYIYSATPLVGQNEKLVFTAVTLTLDEIAEFNRQRFLTNAPTELQQAMQYSKVSAIVQKHLDDAAKAMGYDDIRSAISYIGSPNTTYSNEGTALRDWRSDVWTAVNASTATTEAELMASLPKLVV